MYCHLMHMGHCVGCHQRSDRSFFYKGYQFPVCARCTGVLCGNLTAIPLFLTWGGNYRTSIAAALVMLVDWMFQYWDIIESNNLRRLITGIFGGYGIMTAEMLVYRNVVRLVNCHFA